MPHFPLLLLKRAQYFGIEPSLLKDVGLIRHDQVVPYELYLAPME